MCDATEQLVQVMKARLPGIHLRTMEVVRGMNAIRNAMAAFEKQPKTLWRWCSAAGLSSVNVTDGKESSIDNVANFDTVFPKFIESTESLVLVLDSPWDEMKNSVFIKHLKRALLHARGAGKHIILMGSDQPMPMEVQDQVTLIDLTLPSLDDITKYITALADAYRSNEQTKDKVKIDDAAIPDLARACRGLSMDEAKSVTSLAVVRHMGIDQSAVSMAILEKKQIVSRGGFLQYEESNKSLDDIGGLENLKAWIIDRKELFGDEARNAGINAPKGLLMVGVPGAGKTLCGKAISSAWRMPFVKMDMGKIFGQYVGESESNLRSAIRTAEAVAPCVVLLDEIEKGTSQGGGDGGTSQRVLGALLSWMQDRQADVFIVATANDVSKLPPELMRKGRFDNIFTVDLPDVAARNEIFRIHLSKADSSEVKNVGQAAYATRGFTGAEIESVTQTARIAAFNAPRKMGDARRKVNDDDIMNAIRKTVPLSKTAPEKIKLLREWGKQGRAEPAGKSIDDDSDVKNELVNL